MERVLTFIIITAAQHCTQTEEYKQKLIKHYQEKYGVDHYVQTEEFKQKSKQTCLKKYGVEHPFQSSEIREKIKKTCKRKYGVEYASQNPLVEAKRRKTNLETYGFEYVTQNPTIKEKVKQTCIKKYNVEFSVMLPEIREKIRKTVMAKYGVDHVFQSPIIKQKIKEAHLTKIGVDHPSKLLSTREAMRITMTKIWKNRTEDQKNQIVNKKENTNLLKYGTTCYLNSLEYKELVFEKYGVDHYTQTEEMRNKCRETSLKNWGLEHPMQHPIIKKKQLSSCFSKKTFIFPSGYSIDVQGYEPQAINTLLDRGCSEKEIIKGDLIKPNITYYSKGKNHIYFPDIYIPIEKYLIEVKSVWTFENNLKVNIKKLKASRKAGYTIELWIFDRSWDLQNYIDKTFEFETQYSLIFLRSILKKIICKKRSILNLIADYSDIDTREQMSVFDDYIIRFFPFISN